jgi:flagellar motor switch protein FliN/FliY
MGIEKYQSAIGSEQEERHRANSSVQNETPLSFLSDVPLQISVELGRTEMSIGKLLNLKRGSVIALDHEKDTPLDFRINGNKVATGEVVVVNENYGLRITSVLEPEFGLEED